MNFTKLSLAVALAFVASTTNATAILETEPAVLQMSSKNIVITYHADQGSGGLKGLTSGVYAHTGVITNKSKDSSDWKYAPPKWGDNSEKYALNYEGNNTWTLKMDDLRSYYGITDETEIVKQLAFVFRNEDCTKEGKSETGGDLFIDVQEEGFAMQVTTDQKNAVLLAPTTVNVTVNATTAADFTVAVNGVSIGSATGVTEYKTSFKVDATGQYIVTVVGKTASEQIEEELTFLHLPQAVKKDYPGGKPIMGAIENSDGSVTFCLGAPSKTNVLIVGSWDGYEPLEERVMNYQDYNGFRYFWTTVSGLNRNEYYPYYYLVDGKIKVGDPYAHLVLDPYQDKWLDSKIWPDMPKYPYDLFEDTMLAVYHGAEADYDWEVKDFKIPEHGSLVVYEMLFRDFTAAKTIKGAMSYFTHLTNLGVNAVELMPVMEFNGNNSWGYNTNFYQAPDKAYGSPEDLREFIDLCHKNGIAVILDIVFNQSDGLTPWYQMYNISSNPFYNQYAPHDYSVLNDWNQDNAMVQQYFDDTLRYWLKAYNVDGFRFDLVKGLGDNGSYGGGTEAYNQSRVDRMKKFHAVIKEVKPNGIHINENLAGYQEENAMAEDGQLNWANVNNASCQIAMGWSSDSDASRFYSPKDTRTWGSTVAYAESHDEQRMGYKQSQWGATDAIKTNWEARCNRLGTVAAEMLMAPGPKMIWQFGELGDDENTKNKDGGNNTDPKKPWWFMLDEPAVDGLLTSYKELIGVRMLNPELFKESANINMSFNGWDNGRFVVLTAGNQEAVLLCNPTTDKTVTVSAPVQKISSSNMKVLSSSYNYKPEVSVSGGNVSISIPAGSYAVVGTGDLSGIGTIAADGDVCPTFNVVGGKGEIIIAGSYTTAQVFDLAGRPQAARNLIPGIYIVNVDGTSSKVVVR
ncbi:MAG: hypothetical protein HUK14_02515 [Muribaculaceae bacterium]|nr:hypothetical protein [Muribaculaceae bacterium]